MLRYMTAGESHGKALMAILDGVPAGLKIDEGVINEDLLRRMHGYGRGGRMAIELDMVDIVAGVRKQITIGSPLGLMVKNNDYKINELPDVVTPRPGHADLAGIQKYNLHDARDVLERASARETAARVAVGAVAKLILQEFKIRTLSHVTMLGGIEADTNGLSFDELLSLTDVEKSPVRCADKEAEKKMCDLIDKTRKEGDTLGGAVEVIVDNVPVGLGTHVQWDRRLDGALSRALMSVQAVKAVSIGDGIENAGNPGSSVHDPIEYMKKTKEYSRLTNHAGGIEGGMTNGAPVVAKVFMKPIATLMNALDTVDINTKKKTKAATERSDVSAVAACGVVAEAVVAIEIASALIDKFGGDSISEMKRNHESYVKALKEA